MTVLRKAFLLLIPVFMLTGFTSDSPIPLGIINAIGKGDAHALSDFFNDNVEVIILDNENIYSKIQAERVIAGFFETTKPTLFKVVHHGGSLPNRFAIGRLFCKDRTYSVYLLLKVKQQQSIIHHLRIESGEE